MYAIIDFVECQMMFLYRLIHNSDECGSARTIQTKV